MTTPPLRALTVRQPWAWAIVHGGKNVENRVRSLGPYRGPVAIHAGLQHDLDYDPYLIAAAVGAWRRANPDADSADNPDPMLARPLWYGNLGKIIGVVDLVSAHHSLDHSHHPIDMGNCSPWADVDAHHLMLANPRSLTAPIPAKGKLGLWRPDAELSQAIEGALS